MAIRCKMRLDNIFRHSQWGGLTAFFSCQYDEKLAKEDVSFQRATPTGTAEFVIDNPKAAEQLEIGAFYYVDFHPVALLTPPAS